MWVQSLTLGTYRVPTQFKTKFHDISLTFVTFSGNSLIRVFLRKMLGTQSLDSRDPIF